MEGRRKGEREGRWKGRKDRGRRGVKEERGEGGKKVTGHSKTRPIAISRVLTLKNRHTLRLCIG